ncbi:Oxoglutarate and iron-dependent oxygenase degradation C-term-domain-containing protein [Ostreococcus tauri]|uniref:Oxoglutarate and iron-dependent oxygenase degradation C-term-domain-containing protein n=1 Tax=Ostreococcus tauri TaxID=70448 RepID=A0A1Y5HXN7_OSTTA|nr:Oxoglutarate and iron-dependent oxygenase degradation C-term-domain-containing protein [Ostreococcus tauri]
MSKTRKTLLNSERLGRQWLLAPELFDAQYVEKKAAEYTSALPYRHVCFNSVCDDGRLRKVLEELEGHLTLSFKETDLFKVLQSVDLASLDVDGLQDACINLIALRNELYSDKFRQLIEQVTGCPKLESRVDCSCNVYPTGGHLLCHDDVIGTRCVSYILYLSEPDEEWTLEDGGALELYSVTTTTPSLPESVPSKEILPKWNSMVVFGIEPGKSFHAVQEVHAQRKSRVSISGWFHVAHSKHILRGASAQTLLHGTHIFTQSTGDKDMKLIESTLDTRPIDSSPFREDDRENLRRWVNSQYLSGTGIQRLQDHFSSRGSMLLRDFLHHNIVRELKSLMTLARKEFSSTSTNGHDFGTCWTLCGPPHVRRFLQCTKNSKEEAEMVPNCTDIHLLLCQIRSHVFNSGSFERWLASIVGSSNLGVTNAEIRCFRPGHDYTVAVQKPISHAKHISTILCFVDDFEASEKHMWASGEVGGYICHIGVTKKSVSPAEIYEEEDDDTVLSIDAAFNTLSLVSSGEDGFEFVKYVSSMAPSPRWDISLEMVQA